MSEPSELVFASAAPMSPSEARAEARDEALMDVLSVLDREAHNCATESLAVLMRAGPDYRTAVAFFNIKEFVIREIQDTLRKSFGKEQEGEKS